MGEKLDLEIVAEDEDENFSDLPGGAGKIAPGTYAPEDPNEARRAFVFETMGHSAFDTDGYTFVEYLHTIDEWVKSGRQIKRADKKPSQAKIFQLIQKD